ncbi:hypothetical protein OZD61_00695 [Wolbachia endosymbiont of Drosophila bocki]|nr:hypothetical protein [Wolbachia endosymbiont of Drosophila bocki]
MSFPSFLSYYEDFKQVLRLPALPPVIQVPSLSFQCLFLLSSQCPLLSSQ